MTEAQKFVRTIEVDPLGQLLYRAYKAAPHPAPKDTPPPVDFDKAVADMHGPAHAAMHAKAIDAQRADPRASYAGAYARAYSDTKNSALRAKVQSEHLAAVMRVLPGGA